MSEQAQGVVQFVKQNDYGFYSFKMDDVWYGTGSKKNPGIEKGDKVSFSFYLKDDKWATLKGAVKKLGTGTPASKGSSGVSSGGSTKDGYWEAKAKYEQEVVDPKLTRQFAIREANAFIQNAIAAGTLTGLLKGKDSLDSLRGLLIDTANELVAFATGPKAKPAKVEKEEVEAEEDEDHEADALDE